MCNLQYSVTSKFTDLTDKTSSIFSEAPPAILNLNAALKLIGEDANILFILFCNAIHVLLPDFFDIYPVYNVLPLF